MTFIQELRRRLPANWQTYLNAYIFLHFAGYGAWKLHAAHSAHGLQLTDLTFAAETLLLCAVILVRRDHRAVEPSLPRQALALAAFFSGVLMIGQRQTACLPALEASHYIVLTANVLGLFTILNLGRSFGILIAVREVKTSGFYRFVRHPMYATDILLRLGYLLGHPTPLAAAVVVFSVLAYYWRARFEEEFLSRDEVYREYMKRVRARFIPFLF